MNLSNNGSNRVEWLFRAKWGIFIHYLGSMNFDAKGKNFPPLTVLPTADQWNKQVNNFNVEGLVDQLVLIKAKYLIFTIGQISGHYCSPNAIYDQITGISPSKCSHRDLIKDLYTALSPNGIKLMVYFPSDAPRYDKIATKALGWKSGKRQWERYAKYTEKPKLADYQRKWEAIIREYSERWGPNIHGWWIDGCYWPKAMYEKDLEPNFNSFAAALRAGNPQSIIAFNPGVKVPVVSITPEEDFTAGEIANNLPQCSGRWVNQAQYHILTYLGQTWGFGDPRFDADFVKNYTRKVNEQGGVVTWDVAPTREGLIAAQHTKILQELET